MFSVSRDPVTDDGHTYNWFTVPRGSFDELSRYILTHHWSGILWQPAHRKKENFFVADLAVLDFDKDVTKAQALDGFARYRYLMGTTSNDGREKAPKTPGSPSQPACDRFRVIVPFAAPIFSREIYEFNMRVLIERFGADPGGAGAHMKWKPCRALFARQDVGAKVDLITDVPVEFTDAYKRKQRDDFLKRYKGAASLPKRVIDCLQGHVPPGKRNPELFWTCATLFDLGRSFQEVEQLVSKLSFYEECNGRTTIESAARKAGVPF